MKRRGRLERIRMSDSINPQCEKAEDGACMFGIWHNTRTLFRLESGVMVFGGEAMLVTSRITPS